jgi:hypothetical protein
MAMIDLYTEQRSGYGVGQIVPPGMTDYASLWQAVVAARKAFKANRTPENWERLRAAKQALRAAFVPRRRRRGWYEPGYVPGPAAVTGREPGSTPAAAPFLSPAGPVAEPGTVPTAVDRTASMLPIMSPAGVSTPPSLTPPTALPPTGTPPAAVSGLAGPFDAILRAVGLRDPIEHYEPGLANDLPRVFGKYADLVARYSQEVGGLRSHSERARLAGELGKLSRIVRDLQPAFATGGIVGKRERDKLGDLVQGVRDFQSEWRKAKARYGWAPVPIADAAPLPVLELPAAPARAGLPWGWLALGAAALFIFGRR